MDNLKRVLLEAAVVVAVVLFVFLMNVRATLISLTAIPISVLMTLIVFQAFGLTINTMTLGGLGHRDRRARRRCGGRCREHPAPAEGESRAAAIRDRCWR